LHVIEGHCTFNAGGKTVEAGPRTFVSIPRSVERSFTVDAPNSRILNFYTPAGFEMLLMSIATPAAERKAPIPGSAPMPPRWMVEECSREFGQIPVLGLPFAAPPTKDNMAAKPSQTNPIQPYGIEVKNAPAYWSQDILWTVLASSEQTGGSYSLMEELCSKHSGPPPHTHEQDEALYILEGEITLARHDLHGAFVQRSADRHGGGGETAPRLADASKLRGMDAGRWSRADPDVAVPVRILNEPL
jgi:hypothetical protein